MEDPVREIPGVIRSLTTTPPDVQQRTLETYFTPDASFTHPFCRTGSNANSRYLIGMIYRWYKIMSPRIDLSVDSVAYDEQKLRLYVGVSQVFRLWVVPFYAAPVSLVTVLDLRQDKPSGRYRIAAQNDLYQTDEFVKFILPGGVGVLLVVVWQFVATAVSAVCALIFSEPMSWAEERFKISAWTA
ncbi:MAG: hypothetical protein M1832_005537 [Thelocarpon impressellum]|nr:MAG: hypothetical protein M1832_005537 [Thelocarpon impressellum]